jgi:hypothetical protein
MGRCLCHGHEAQKKETIFSWGCLLLYVALFALFLGIFFYVLYSSDPNTGILSMLGILAGLSGIVLLTCMVVIFMNYACGGCAYVRDEKKEIGENSLLINNV